MHVLAIDIGGTQYRFSVINERGEVLATERRETKRKEGSSWLLPRLKRGIEDLLEQGGFNPVAIGIGFGGPVSFSEQRILASLHAPGWEQVDLPSTLAEQLELPCVVDNDANVGALGEYTYGAGKSHKNMLYYTVSTGVGGGIILNGRVFRGVHGQAGELGHMPVKLDGPSCTCGFRGCVESLCSGLAIARQGMDAISDSRISTLLRERYTEEGTLTAKDVFECAGLGDFTAIEIIRKVKEAFKSGVVGAINVFDPEIVVVGGGVGLAPGFLDGLSASVNESLVIPGRRQIPVVAGSLGDNSVLLGAAALAWNHYNEAHSI